MNAKFTGGRSQKEKKLVKILESGRGLVNEYKMHLEGGGGRRGRLVKIHHRFTQNSSPNIIKAYFISSAPGGNSSPIINREE